MKVEIQLLDIPRLPCSAIIVSPHIYVLLLVGMRIETGLPFSEKCKGFAERIIRMAEKPYARNWHSIEPP